jgi:hypothetical protein
MIQIHNLTEYQVEMLDHMWTMDSMEEYDDWFALLDEEDQLLALSLQKLIILEEMEELLGNYKDANDVLKKFALQK